MTRQRTNRLATTALLTHFLLSGVYWVASSDKSSVLGRIGSAEIWLAALLLFVLIEGRGRLSVPRSTFHIGAFLLVCLLSAALQINERSLLDLAIASAGPISYLAIFHLGRRIAEADPYKPIWLWTLATGILAIIGILDFICYSLFGIGLPRPQQFEAQEYGLTGTFRNTGQAGAYFSVGVLVGLPYALVENGRRGTAARTLVGVTALALLLTAKRAGWVGAAVGVVIAILQAVRKGIVQRGALLLLGVIGAGAATYSWTLQNFDHLRTRTERKIGAADQILDERSFWRSNIRDAVQIFAEHPVLGIGLGGASEATSTGHEIHSTYFAVIAELGLIGFLAYMGMMISLWRATLPSPSSPEWTRWRSLVSSAWIGMLVMFVYVYHLRKREFWVAAAVMAVVAAAAKKLEGKKGEDSREGAGEFP